jgi:hypothetical protein
MKYLVLLVVLVFLVYGVLYAIKDKKANRPVHENAVFDFASAVLCGFYILTSHIRDGAVAAYKGARDDLKP